LEYDRYHPTLRTEGYHSGGKTSFCEI
jgi:hypothetical protein